jgi:hypothetical protein
MSSENRPRLAAPYMNSQTTPQEHKTAAYRYNLRRIRKLPISNENKEKELKIITQMA